MHAAQQGLVPALDLSDFPGHRAKFRTWTMPGRPGHHVGADDPPAGAAHARELATPVAEAQLRSDQIPDP
jgi:hypothetical protein